MPELKDFECAICMKLLFKPVTTACGHNYCKFCVDLASRYNSQCPICRCPLNLEYSPNILLTELIKERFPNEVLEREREAEEGRLENEERLKKLRQEIGENASAIPIYFRWNIYPPVFPGDSLVILVKTLAEYRTIQIALLPITINVRGKARVELTGPLVKTGYGCFMSNAVPFYDDSLVTDEKVEVQFPDLENKIALKLLRKESFNEEYMQITEILKGQLDLNQKHHIVGLLMSMCRALVIRQIEVLNSVGRRRVDNIYGRVQRPSLDEPSGSELESLSLLYARMVVATNSEKKQWFACRDTLQRFNDICRILIMAGDHCVLNLE
ncbi:bifunctional Zinc finger [Babesia duncani]|uniref:Bifunctional Zinc finger n=1 Tax=Babesia duncani TaxID=323732 RepID=A0AAD9UQT7_9APIC|nr:bifunctional Zinc finger [Babesia duncani]